jgi:PAS domain S-box-containing protein
MTTALQGVHTEAPVTRPIATTVAQQQQQRRAVATAAPAALDRRGSSYDALVEHAAEALLVVEDGQRCYSVVNLAAERLLQFTRAELLGLGPDDVSDPADAPRLQEVRAHLAAHELWHGQWALRRKDGSIVHTDATVVRVVVGGLVLKQGLFRERTERTLEDALQRAHDIQHQLNNQLALITGYAEILAQDPRLPADLRDAAREALVGGLGAVEAGKLLIACFTADRP